MGIIYSKCHNGVIRETGFDGDKLRLLRFQQPNLNSSELEQGFEISQNNMQTSQRPHNHIDCTMLFLRHPPDHAPVTRGGSQI